MRLQCPAIDNATGFGRLFNTTPYQMHLRGDYHLWRTMQVEFDGVAMPTSELDVAMAVERAYEGSVGQPLPSLPAWADAVYVEHLSTGSGMSDGHVAPHFWRYTAIPLIIDRWAAQR